MADSVASPVHFALAFIVFFLDLLHDVVLNAKLITGLRSINITASFEDFIKNRFGWWTRKRLVVREQIIQR